MATETTSTDSFEQEDTQTGQLGRLLKEYRETAEMDISQLAEALCLTPSAVKALENEDFSNLPEAPYVRGYLRSYARLAEADPSKVIALYEDLRGSSPEELEYNFAPKVSLSEVTKPSISPMAMRLGLLVGLLLLLGLLSMIPGVKDWTSSVWARFSQPNATQSAESPGTDLINNPSLTGNIPGNLPGITTEDEGTPVAGETGETPNNADTSQIADSETAATHTANAEGSATDANTQEQKPAADEDENAATDEAGTPGDTNIKLTFSKEVWMRIRDKNGKTVFEALNPAGTEKVLSLTKPLNIRVGNAQGLELTVNGEKMDISEFIKGSIARFVIE
jgi:cytoskeletal protein RodZ